MIGRIGRAARGRGAELAAAIAREAVVSALRQRVVSVLTLAVVAAVCASVLLTSGRTEGSATEVLSSLDDSGTRSVVVRAEPAAGLDTSVLERLRVLGGIEWFAAFGPADDVTNTVVAGGAPVALRAFYGATSSFGGRASPSAARVLGLADGMGAVVSRGSGRLHDVTGLMDLPSDLRFLDPVVLVAPAAPEPIATALAGPGGPTPAAVPEAEPVALVVVRAATPADVAAVAAAVTSVLGVADPTTVTVQTSERLAAVRRQVENQLDTTGHALVLSTFAASAVVLAAILSALVLLRRRDFGRRRALGASRSLVAGLLLTQVAVLAVTASILGCGVALATLAITRQPLPTLPFTTAVAVLATLTSLAAAVVPAAVASTRDPLRELRVP